jgi:very-short-patch-repair endonuclease
MPRKVTLDEIDQRLHKIHDGKVILLDREGYIHTHHKVMFRDIDYGDWLAAPYSVLTGRSHPKRGKEKAKKHFQEKYGVDNPYQAKECKDKIRQTMLTRYGVEYVGQTQANRKSCESLNAQVKKHNTMKKNKTYKKSFSEDEFYDMLCIKFGTNNVERQVLLNNWRIDFYIQDINLYVQFDGVYWHGLDRDIEKIKEFKHKRDKKIYETWCRDQKQNEWFKQQNIKLIRILDIEWFKNKQINL